MPKNHFKWGAGRSLRIGLWGLALCFPLQALAGEVTTVAGGGEGDLGALRALLNAPQGISGDAQGNLYIADTGNNQIYRVDAASREIAVVAGNGRAGFFGDGGFAPGAHLDGPAGLFVDAEGNFYFADRENNRVRKVEAETGLILTVAGNGNPGFSGDGNAATAARLNRPSAVFVDRAGHLYIADTENNRVRKVDALSGDIATLAGTGGIGAAFGSFAGDEGPAEAALLKGPSGVCVDGAGHLYIADAGNNRIRRVDADTGIITTVAGSGTIGFGGDGGPATEARLNLPSGLFIDASGNIFIADTGNNRIRQVDPSGSIRTVAGNGEPGFGGDGEAAAAALFSAPSAVFVDVSGHLYVVDTGNNRIRRDAFAAAPTAPTPGIYTPPSENTPPAIVTSWPVNRAINIDPDFILENGINVLFSKVVDPGRMRFQVQTGDRTLNWVAEWTDGNVELRLRPDSALEPGAEYRVTLSQVADYLGNLAGQLEITFTTRGTRQGPIRGNILTVAGTGEPGFVGDGDFVSEMQVDSPGDIFVDGDGNVYVVDTGNNRIRKVDGQTGIVVTVAGGGPPGLLPQGARRALRKQARGGLPATIVGLEQPAGVFVDGDRALYVADSGNNRVHRVDDATGMMTTVAGNGAAGFSGDGSGARSASLNGPEDVFVDGAGNIYISDRRNSRVRKVDPLGVITTVAGNGTPGYTGDGGPATDAGLGDPRGIYVDVSGNLYIADGSRVRKVDAATGVITTVAGGAGFGAPLGDGGPATLANLAPEDVEVDFQGNLYISGDSRVRKVDAATGVITTVAGTGKVRGFSGDGGPATDASLSSAGIFVDPATGDLYIADRLNHRIRRVEQVAPVLPSGVGGGQAEPPVDPELAGVRAADFNGDGRVDFSDFVDLVQHFGSREGEPLYSAKNDLDGNGNVGFSDFVLFVKVFGKSTGGG